MPHRSCSSTRVCLCERKRDKVCGGKDCRTTDENLRGQKIMYTAGGWFYSSRPMSWASGIGKVRRRWRGWSWRGCSRMRIGRRWGRRSWRSCLARPVMVRRGTCEKNVKYWEALPKRQKPAGFSDDQWPHLTGAMETEHATRHTIRVVVTIGFTRRLGDGQGTAIP